MHTGGARGRSVRVLDQLIEQAPDASVRQRIFVDNLAALYGFGREG